MLDSLLQQNVSLAERLLTGEKDRRKAEIVAGGRDAFLAHIGALNERLGKSYMPAIPADFAGCVKGLKSLASMEDKVAGELARAKIAANAIADGIDKNLRWLRENAEAFKFLFSDVATIVLKPHDDMATLAGARITEHKAAEQRHLDAERERIRKEEQERADREARERAAAEQRAQETQARQAAEAAKPAPTPAPVAIAAPASPPQSTAANSPNVVPMGTRAPTAKPTLKLGQINERIAPLQVTAAGLEALGFKPVKEGSAQMYHEHQFADMVDSMVAQLRKAQASTLQAA